MPKPLLERFQPDSIGEFRAAARQRHFDAIALLAAGRRTAAIYLWGYAAEMTLKAAYFEVSGFPENRTINLPELRNALRTVVAGNASLHHLGLWAQALVILRSATLGRAYADPMFGSVVTAKAQSLYDLWRETIRYHKNVAYPHEVARAREAAEWLLAHSADL